MKRLAGLLIAMLAAQPLLARAELYYLIVGGIGGEPKYTERFADDVAAMAAAAERTLGGDERVKVLSGDEATRDALRAALADLAGSLRATDRLAVFLIGHGSYDGREYKLNLRGDDITGTEIAELLAAVPAASQLVVNATSSSGHVLDAWAADGRTVIVATRGNERNATRFAAQWAAALSSDDADLNKNGSISAQEAFDYASRLVADSFESEGGLATEHAQLEGDAASAFEVSRLEARVAASPEVEELNRQMSDLEEQVAALQLRRNDLGGDEYQRQMLDLQVRIARLQAQIDAAGAE